MLRDHSSRRGWFVIVGFEAIEGFVLTLWMTLMSFPPVTTVLRGNGLMLLHS